MDYIPKVGKIYTVTLTDAGTWYAILTAAQANAIRGVKIRSRLTYDSNGNPTNAPRPFAIATNSSPDESGTVSDGTGFITIDSGTADTFGPSSGLWAKGFRANTVIEVMTFE